MTTTSRSKTKTIYTCSICAAQSPKWLGQCPDCNTWNTYQEEVISTAPPRYVNYSGETATQSVVLSEVNVKQDSRLLTGLPELDRALGGGLVPGSVVLIGGDPGIGKSTLLLQTLCSLSQYQESLYVTGEESLQQVAMRARRLGLSEDKLKLFPETHIEKILALAGESRPTILAIDSIQTMYTQTVQSAPGAVSQVRESAAQLVRYAKQTGTALFLIGHVTKEGTIAGPRVLEHMVDTVLYFEGERDHRYRIIRAIKNRFGAVNELGIFAMTDKGLRTISNPSAIFLSHQREHNPGNIVMSTWEGSRPLLVEIQALVDESHLANPRRVTVGLEQNRLAMLLAVLHRHGGIVTYDQDVFVNAVGGVKVSETAADLPILLAILSSLRNKPLPAELMAFGEIGLAGEIRPVQSGQERLQEAQKHGFKKAIIPKNNAPRNKIPGLEIISVQTLSEALSTLN
ncbi:MAG: DNA repair protein RadA [Gammaproteobacteria bacterium RIFCSPLOWO2_02_FULL_38_11]|nr:MAG: DNA repair protein RadA [Gammaproteobacteria bacterium RIFCSPLOWO2_02_FULL_38_11]OGT78080.1 MAG: DNA repair protein RadA [Gammaproteobacteria bacterium RIFCSPLOWO2_12_FULL_38_14]